jgi:hypothetical protein
MSAGMRAPLGTKLLAAFFAAGALVSLTTAVALASPGGPLDPIWRLKPAAQQDFGRLGGWAILLMVVVSTACATDALALWYARPWSRRFAAVVLAVNLAGDAVNATAGREPASALGVPARTFLSNATGAAARPLRSFASPLNTSHTITAAALPRARRTRLC